MKKIEGVKSIAAAKGKGAQISNVKQVTFAAPVFIQSTGGVEPALSGAVAAVKAGAFASHPVKGYNGVYLFKVNAKKDRPVKFDQKATLAAQRQKMLQNAGGFMQELYRNAEVKDNRYLFF